MIIPHQLPITVSAFNDGNGIFRMKQRRPAWGIALSKVSSTIYHIILETGVDRRSLYDLILQSQCTVLISVIAA